MAAIAHSGAITTFQYRLKSVPSTFLSSTDTNRHVQEDQWWLQSTMLAIYSPILLVGVLGNMLVAYIIISDKKMRANVTNIFILNLAAADFWLLLVAVQEIVRDAIYQENWSLGMLACKVLRSSMILCLYVSVLTLTAVCIERWVKHFDWYCQFQKNNQHGWQTGECTHCQWIQK